MHPAYSVIIFTTLSGAGYGLLVWLAYSVLVSELLPLDATAGAVAFGLALLLVSAGLLSSTLHLGRPERAWRAFSQWRSSWLSREGVLAVATYPAAGLFALLWILDPASPWLPVTALITASLALVTVYCTGMIYGSLPTIRAWHQPHVAPVYIALSLITGATLALLLATVFKGEVPVMDLAVALAIVVAGFALKWSYWHTIDNAPRTLTAGSATGLGRFGEVRVLEAPHSRPNFVMREMGYTVARKHAEKLRWIAVAGLFIVPAVAVVLAMVSAVTLPWVAIAVAAAGLGVAVERWLFFAEAEHAVTLFYGNDAA